MPFIGILTEHITEIYLNEQLKRRKWGKVFFLDEKTIENMHNIRFETFLLGKKVVENQDTIRYIAQNASYFVLNSDIKENLCVFENLDLKVITYGYNQKATITTSSVEENKMMICLQRSIKNVYQEKIEPQEFEFEMSEEINNEALMEFASLDLLYSKKE